MPTHRFDGFEYDTACYRLSGTDSEITLEPKVAELLDLLIRNRDRVVGRAEIFDNLWPNQEVGDAALSRLLYELRKALGDDASNPRFLRTVPRRGIQFVAALEQQAPVETHPAAQAAPAVAQPKRSKALGVALAAVAVAAVFALLLAAITRSAKPTVSKPQADARIAILTGMSPGVGSQASMVMVTVSDLLSSRLAALPGVVVRSPLFVESELPAAGSVEAFARDSQVDYVLSLSLAPASSDSWVRLQGALLQMRGTQPPWRTSLDFIELPVPTQDQDLKIFLKARDLMVQKVADEVGVLVGGVPPGSAPRRLEAWRLYLQAKAMLQSLTCVTGGATSLLQRVVELDPGFAGGWSVLGFAHYNQAWACSAGRPSALKALDAMRQARKLDPGDPGTVFLEVSLLTELGQAGDAVRVARQGLEQVPGNPVVMSALGYALTYQGNLEKAADLFADAVAIDPLVLSVEAGLTPSAFLHLGRWQRYLALAPAGDAPIERYYRAYAHWRLGESTQARNLTAGCLNASKADVFGTFCRALDFILIGDSASAGTVLRALHLERQNLDVMDGEIDFKIAQLLTSTGNKSLALEAASQAWQLGFHCARCFAEDPLLAELRSDTAVATAFAAIYRNAAEN